MFGASSSTGRALLRQLDTPVWAVSRRAQPPQPPVQWLCSSLADLDVPTAVHGAAVVSLGPLPDFVAWLTGQPWLPRQVIALSSASVLHKAHSPAATEQQVVARLLAAEARLEAHARQHGLACTILRPTLIWGGGQCALSGLARLARRLRLVPRPLTAGGARTPLHHADLARVVAHLLGQLAPPPRMLLLGGGETLPISTLVERVVRTVGGLSPRCPGPLLRAGMTVARGAGLRFGDGLLDRWEQDQGVDTAAVWQEAGWTPRPFNPGAADWEPAA